MKVQPFIVASYTRRSQEIACQNFADLTKNIIQRRVYGAVLVAFASLRDAFHATWLGLIELKQAITDRPNFKQHIRDAVNYFVLAKLFVINAFFSPAVNFIDPALYLDIVNFPADEVEQLRATLNTKTEEADQLQTALTTKTEEADQLQTALTTKTEEANQLRADLVACQGALEAEKGLHAETKDAHAATQDKLTKTEGLLSSSLSSTSRKLKSTPSKRFTTGSQDDSGVSVPLFARNLFPSLPASNTSSDNS
jgi:hypothetical protein